MSESIVLICPTWQALMPAANQHDGQFAHGMYAGIARRVGLIGLADIDSYVWPLV
ncbi:hypothetical protein [Bradyrhizobium sp. SRS-191]|uniref:hypothetical protein n=1 Tax=Bradyrhizobium sp. SRS-191 TaxID=2962606 RepID=UPI00211E4C6D|nr:hypothetical protein [Bradyrhizobium sp. SRS-191]